MSAAALVLCSMLLAAESRPAPRVIAVCDFESPADNGKLGQRVAEALRMKLARYESEFIVAEPLDVNAALAAAGIIIHLETKPEPLAAVGKETLAADILVWGKLDAAGDSYTIHARALDLKKTPAELYIDTSFPANGPREIPFAVQRIVNAVRRDEAAPDPAFDPREPGPGPADPNVLARPNLLVNGDFEKGDTTPTGWERVDGLVSHWVNAPGRPGKCVEFDTDVSEAQWLDWHKKFTLGTTDPPPAPIRGQGPKYDTVGGNHGAWLYNADSLPVKPGQTYRISFDFRGKMSGDLFFAKVFVKGYADIGGEKREVYRAYKSCRTKTGGRDWEHFARTFNPTDKAPNVKWMKVEIYTYWPPGLYYVDNVHLCTEP